LSSLFKLLTDGLHIVLDMKDVSLINREVLRFLVSCEADGVRLENCAPYIREWIEREKD
jgi:predicted metal-binding protein